MLTKLPPFERLADDDPDAPWMNDIRLGGMSPKARRLSWLAAQDLTQSALATAPLAERISPRQAPRFIPQGIDQVEMSAKPAYLIQGLLPAHGLVCIVGLPKSGKSFFASDMLCAVARGVPYGGRRTLRGPVIYLTGEGVSGFKRRLVAMREHLGIAGQEVPFYLVEQIPDLGSEKTDLPDLLADLDVFIARTGMERPCAIVLDTLARSMGEADENSARDMGRFVNRCSEIERHFGCVVVVVHHTGKDPTRGGRGSNALNGAADVTLMVTKRKGFSVVRVEEMKDGPEGQEWRFRLLPRVSTETPDPCSEGIPEVSTCVVELLSEPTETAKTKELRGITGDLLKVITRAIEEAGERDFGCNVSPKNARAVSRSVLKRFCMSMGWQDPEGKPDSFRAVLNKTLNALRSRNLIDFDRDWVWLR